MCCRLIELYTKAVIIKNSDIYTYISYYKEKQIINKLGLREEKYKMHFLKQIKELCISPTKIVCTKELGIKIKKNICKILI